MIVAIFLITNENFNYKRPFQFSNNLLYNTQLNALDLILSKYSNHLHLKDFAVSEGK